MTSMPSAVHESPQQDLTSEVFPDFRSLGNQQRSEMRPELFPMRVWLAICFFVAVCSVTFAAPLPPSGLTVVDHPLDGGAALDVRIRTSSDDPHAAKAELAYEYLVLVSGEFHGEYKEVARVKSGPRGSLAMNVAVEFDLTTRVTGRTTGTPYWFRVYAINPAGEKSAFVETPLDAPGIATRQWFDGRRMWLAGMMTAICGAVVGYVIAARMGVKLTIRKIAGLDAIEDAVGRATEMGKTCLFVPGVQDINDIQTIAGLTILGKVAEKAAEYDCELDVPTSRSLVMTAARETVAAAFYAAGRPDAYNEDRIYYVTDEQFAYVSHLTGIMVREKPAACFYLGAFFAESLILSETGNAVGAIQIAGTAQPAQLPFFVAACDYTLIGEEFFAASAYLSGDPDQLGSLKGQDVGKVIVTVLVIIGGALSTLANVSPAGMKTAFRSAENYMLNTMLGEG